MVVHKKNENGRLTMKLLSEWETEKTLMKGKYQKIGRIGINGNITCNLCSKEPERTGYPTQKPRETLYSYDKGIIKSARHRIRPVRWQWHDTGRSTITWQTLDRHRPVRCSDRCDRETPERTARHAIEI